MNALDRLYMSALKAAAKKRRVSSGGAKIPAGERSAFKARALKSAKRKYPKRIEIVGRRWFRKSYGNTYFTAKVYANDKLVVNIPMQYGYGDHYVDVAWGQLERMGIVPKRKVHASGGSSAPWAEARDLGIKLKYHAIDVAREKDL